jgi:integrase
MQAMAKKALTAKFVEALKPHPTKRREVPDAALPGLYLVVQSSGTKSWALRYRFAGKPAKLTLGRWPLVGLAEARAAATEALDMLAKGRNPAAEKRATKAARLEAQLSERDKIKTLVEQFDQRHLSGIKSGRAVRARLDRYVLPVWGERDIHSITRRDVLELLESIKDGGHAVTANRVRTHLGTFFNWCVERDILNASPAQGVKAVAKEQSRERVLSDDEIRWLWRACDAEGYPWGSLGKVLLLTGQRLSEVAGMSEAEVTGDVWRLTGVRVKNGRPHDVPLSGAVRAILEALERPNGPAGLLFTTNGRTPVSAFHRARCRLHAAMERIAAEERGAAVAIPHWTFHDLRRTCASAMAKLGIPVRVTEAVLNHVSGTGAGIVAVYQRHDYAAEKRAALEAWAGYVQALVDGKPDNVVRLEARR